MSFIYVDNIAGTKIDDRVLSKMMPYLSENYGNPSAHFYPLGRQSFLAINEARDEVCALIKAGEDERVIFTSSGTESNNLAIKGLLYNHSEKKHVIISEIEHISIQNVLIKMMKDGYSYTILKVDNGGKISLDELEKAIKKDTAMVALSHANSEIGVIQDVEKIGEICKKHNVHFHLDAVASAGFVDIDVKKFNVDTLSLASQNIYGPRGAGALYVKDGVKLKSLFDGGHQEFSLRSGSENVVAIVGFGEACKIAREDMSIYLPKITKLRDKLIAGLGKAYDFLHFTGDMKDRLPYHISFWIEYIEGESLLMWYSQKGVYAASGSACSSNILAEDEEDLVASHVLTAVGVPTDICAGSITMTLSKYNSEEDIDYILKVTPEIVDKLCAMSPAFNRK